MGLWTQKHCDIKFQSVHKVLDLEPQSADLAGQCPHFLPTIRHLLHVVAGLLPPPLALNQSGTACLSTAASDQGPEVTLHYRSCSGSQLSCSTRLRNQELDLYSIVFVIFVFLADYALLLLVGNCNY